MVTDDVFAVIAEATRREILVSLRSGDKAVGELVEELSASQPTISKHLKVLREADLVSMRAQGQKRYYALNPKPLADVASWLETFDVGRRTDHGDSPASSAAEDSAPASSTAPDTGTQSAAGSAFGEAVPEPAGAAPGRRGAPGGSGTLAPAVTTDDSMPQQIGRTVGRAATKAADILANLPKVPNLPKFGRKK